MKNKKVTLIKQKEKQANLPALNLRVTNLLWGLGFSFNFYGAEVMMTIASVFFFMGLVYNKINHKFLIKRKIIKIKVL